MKKIIFTIAVMLSINANSQTLGLERFKRSEGNMKYILFNNLQDALDTYKQVVEDNGFFYKDAMYELTYDEEVLLSYTITNENDACMFFIATRPTGGYILEVYTIPNDKQIDVRDSKRSNGEYFTYQFDPEK
jgi:hypothetical protein